MHKSEILITCAKGIPPFLKQEVLSLDYPVLSENIAGVSTEGTLEDALRLNLLVRTGHRVLYRLAQFTANTADELYRGVSAISWESVIPDDGHICITSSVENASIRDTRFATLRSKDAIVDRIRERTGKRPDSGSARDRSVVHVYWKDERCVVYLDTSGESLSRRGYRKIPLVAPMQETLAAAVVSATDWNGAGAFINPMCGSGTIAIEAALVALHRAPGMLRANFGFMHIKGFKESLWSELREKAKKEEKAVFPGRIIATDVNPEAVAAARKNAAIAGVEEYIEFKACPFEDTPLPDGGGVVVMNPEYGERMGEAAKLETTYKRIGDYLKQKCKGYTGYVFTGNAVLAKKVSLKPKRAWQFFNSGIACRLLEYELYEGSRRPGTAKAAT